MKKIFFTLLTSVLLFSCGKNKREQMLYDYHDLKAKELFSTNIKDLDFEINSVEKVSDIKASDSIKIYENMINNHWFVKNPSYKNKDRLKYEIIILQLDSVVNKYDEMIDSFRMKNIDYRDYDFVEYREIYNEEKVMVESWKRKSDLYSQNPDSILSTKYKASYSIINPTLKIKENFIKAYYTNASQTKFIHEET